MVSPPVAPPHVYVASPTLSSTLGALEIGIFVAICLFGIGTAQVYIYFRQFPDDSWRLKLLVTVVWVLDFGHTVCISYSLYIGTIVSNGSFSDVPTVRVYDAATFFEDSIALLVQFFFTFRVWRLVGPYIAGICFALSLFDFAGALYAGAVTFLFPTTVGANAKYARLFAAVSPTSAVVDIVNTVSLCWFLKRQRHIVLPSTTRAIDEIIVWTLQTGLLTSITAVAGVATFLTMPNNFIWAAIYAVLTKFFSNSLYASLNARIRFGQTVRGVPSRGSAMGAVGAPRSTLRFATAENQEVELAPINIELHTRRSRTIWTEQIPGPMKSGPGL